VVIVARACISLNSDLLYVSWALMAVKGFSEMRSLGSQVTGRLQFVIMTGLRCVCGHSVRSQVTLPNHDYVTI